MDHRRAARRMVEKYIIPQGIKDKRILDVMMEIPRHLFVEEALQGQAYGDNAIPIGDGQSISRPNVVARMTDALCLTGDDRVLEIGGGSAYQSAILSRLAKEVYTVERLKTLASKARNRLLSVGCQNVLFKVGDGTLGWKDKSPFDAILVAASSPDVPGELLEQLAEGGRLVIPLGRGDDQKLKRYIREGGNFVEEELGECNFVPLIGAQGWKESDINANN